MARHTAAARNAIASAIGTLMAGGSVEIVAGTQRLAALPLSAVVPAPIEGRLVFRNLSATVDADGTADSYVVRSATGEALYSGAVGKAGEIKLDLSTLKAGMRLDVPEFQYVVPVQV